MYIKKVGSAWGVSSGGAPPRAPFGPMGPNGAHLDPIGSHLDPQWGPLGPKWAELGHQWVTFGPNRPVSRGKTKIHTLLFSDCSKIDDLYADQRRISWRFRL
mgnify:CR=1 FL=1